MQEACQIGNYARDVPSLLARVLQIGPVAGKGPERLCNGRKGPPMVESAESPRVPPRAMANLSGYRGAHLLGLRDSARNRDIHVPSDIRHLQDAATSLSWFGVWHGCCIPSDIRHLQDLAYLAYCLHR